MVRIRHLLVMSLTSAVFCTFAKAACVQEAPCLKTRVLQSSPEVPKKECADCEEKSSEVQKENFVLLPLTSDSSFHQPHDYVSDFIHRQKLGHEPSRYHQDGGVRHSHEQSSSSQEADHASDQVQEEKYVLVPITSELSDNEPQIISYRPEDHVSHSGYHQKLTQQPSRHPGFRQIHEQSSSSQETSHSSIPHCDSLASCQANFYLLQSSTQVINHIQQAKDQKPLSHSQVPRGYKPIVAQPSYQPKITSNTKSSYKTQYQDSPLHHLATGRPVSVNEPIEKPHKPKYQPVRLVYSTKPRVTEYSSGSSSKETKKNYAGKTSYGRKKTDEKKLGYEKAPTKESLRISCQKCQKIRNESPTKGHQCSCGRY